jgi:23S rRNA pseudouridine2605 synthase
MRINKYLADSGVCSRRGADKLIEEGRVKLNGKTVKELGANVNENNDSVTVDGRKVSPVSTYTYLLFNKPKGCVSTVKDEKDRKTVMDFINIPGKRLYPVGRLDYDSEGMMIITDDGSLAFRLTHPMNEIFKTYIVKIEGDLSLEDLAKLRSGVVIDGVKSNRSFVKVLECENNISRIEVRINEGKNHHIKKMFEAVGKNVIFLKRVAIGEMRLGGLNRGEYRDLREDEVFYLKNL